MSSDFFRPEEEKFITRVEDLFNQVQTYNYYQLTNFLNKREQVIVNNIANRYSAVNIFWSGGYYNSERQRAIIAPDYYQLSQEDFQITGIEIKYPTKFGKLKHSQILGTLVSLGIDRNFFGDIITDGTRWNFLVESQMTEYVIGNLQKIGNLTVSSRKIDLNKLLLPRDDSETETITSQSFRLDSVISSVYSMSRQNAKDAIKDGKVTVNWLKTNKADYFLTIGDTVSVRGFGRIRIDDYLGKTQNSKWKILVNIIRK